MFLVLGSREQAVQGVGLPGGLGLDGVVTPPGGGDQGIEGLNGRQSPQNLRGHVINSVDLPGSRCLDAAATKLDMVGCGVDQSSESRPPDPKGC